MIKYPEERNYDVKKNKIIYRRERSLVIHVLTTLANIKIFAWRNNTTGFFDTKRMIWRKSKDQLNGISDILGILPDGKFLAIELKTEYCKASIEQKDFIDRINDRNGIGMFAKSIDDVLNRLKEAGYIDWDGYIVKRKY